MGQREFVALMAMLAATVAFSIDAMLPALAQMGAELSPDTPDRAALVVTAFVGGMGLGTFFAGPLSDAYGRRTIMFAGAAVYIVASATAAFAHSLEALLVARFVQGIGAAGPRIASMAMIRDRYQGREMARILSFVMVVFTLVARRVLGLRRLFRAHLALALFAPARNPAPRHLSSIPRAPVVGGVSRDDGDRDGAALHPHANPCLCNAFWDAVVCAADL